MAVELLSVRVQEALDLSNDFFVVPKMFPAQYAVHASEEEEATWCEVR